MNQEPSNQEELMTRWIDGELSGPERAAFERKLEDDPRLRGELEVARGLGGLLRAELEGVKEPPYPELFNSRVMKRIVSDRDAGRIEDSKIVRPHAGTWSKLPWLITAAAVIIAALLLFERPDHARQPGSVASSETMNTYAPRDGVVVRTRFVPEAGATVLSLEGLDEVPSGHEIEGDLVANYQPVAPGDAPVFTSLDDGEPLFVLLTNADNIPSVVRFPRIQPN